MHRIPDLRQPILAICMALAAATLASADQPAERPVAFTGNATEGFQFVTEAMEGTIRLDGAYHGVTRLVDRRSGRQVIDARYSALNLFKLMSVNLMLGQPRQMERTTRSGPDWAEASWAATDAHHAVVTARYTLRPPEAIDLTVTVRAKNSYTAYEVFLSNYFDKVLQPHVWLCGRKPDAADPVLPMVNDVFRGTVLVFARDAHAARHCLDGRWDRNEAKTPTVQMCPVRHYAECLAVQAEAEKKLGVALMADPRDCYALSTRYHADNDADRLTTYSAFDMSLFGGDFSPGDERSVRVRLCLTQLNGTLEPALDAYRRFLADNAPQEGKP